MSVLETLGWAPSLDAQFEPHRQKGLIPGRVAAQHRGGYVLYTEEGETPAELAGELRHAALGLGELPAVGDWVAARPARDLATIHAVLPRRTGFSRKVAGDRTAEQVLAANIDAVFLVSGLDGDFNQQRLERYLTMAWESGAQPVVVLSKADLCAAVELRVAEVEAVAIGVPVHPVNALGGEGVDQLEGYFAGNRTVALLGSSGVGKSTLVNRLTSRELQRTQEVRDDGRGRHTTTRRELIPLPGGGFVLDTPGLRELQLWDGAAGLGQTFEDVEALARECRFSDCRHESEPGCAVKRALADGSLSAERFASYRKLERELRALELRQDRLARAAEVRLFKIRARGRHAGARRRRTV